ncbi:NUDIX hydrolase N-terminal domain-containing protein [Oceanirhabdus seepicola]|uniref:NUDIX hydrolase N-terminal domain-containing protein n=1 Tax=Oceanirhabdus seepicola TaxID=2828781 RepID=A0A9J6P0E6_9CLOT|nr:NUDIX hydrolase N-terminal domain-containing protein [Oceanirhabdus seepicola]MCM1989349.1 NUDIX hydrolase N-terminal domain-containing protein [Oceanirhabdus seepicola]
MKNIVELLDEIRSIAQNGLCYADNEYDRIRYEVLLQIASGEYSNICGIDEKIILERFKNELGYITPKVGVNGVVFSEDGKILLERRADDNQWGIPGGWAEVGESPEQSVQREIYEETGLKVKVKGIIDIFTRLPGQYGQPHTTYHILFHCEVIEGDLKSSFESSEVGFYNYKNITEWHKDHLKMVTKACEYLRVKA